MFRFKQFTIRQERAAMKVCTDACVLGSCADLGTGGRVLDIGTGTGLLALMAAQRNPTALIDAIEIDETAAAQAAENVANSPFAGRVQVVHTRLQDFYPPTSYDRIITNPPFYTGHLRSPDAAVSRALHTDELPFPELLAAIVRLLAPGGQGWVLLPPYETDVLTELAASMKLFPCKRLTLRHNADKPIFRVLTGFSFQRRPILNDALTIYTTDSQTYTPEFRALLQDFYLIF